MDILSVYIKNLYHNADTLGEHARARIKNDDTDMNSLVRFFLVENFLIYSNFGQTNNSISLTLHACVCVCAHHHHQVPIKMFSFCQHHIFSGQQNQPNENEMEIINHRDGNESH